MLYLAVHLTIFTTLHTFLTASKCCSYIRVPGKAYSSRKVLQETDTTCEEVCWNEPRCFGYHLYNNECHLNEESPYYSPSNTTFYFVKKFKVLINGTNKYIGHDDKGEYLRDLLDCKSCNPWSSMMEEVIDAQGCKRSITTCHRNSLIQYQFNSSIIMETAALNDNHELFCFGGTWFSLPNYYTNARRTISLVTSLLCWLPGQPYSTNIECPIDIEDLNLCPDGKDCSMTLWSKRSGLHTVNVNIGLRHRIIYHDLPNKVYTMLYRTTSGDVREAPNSSSSIVCDDNFQYFYNVIR